MANAQTLSTMRTALYLQSHAAPYVKGRLLDAGCGTQPYKRLLHELTTEWVGLDARPVGDVTAYVEQNDLPDESFDTVLCTDMLQYCCDPQVAVAEMARLLAPGGCLILLAPNCQVDDGSARWSFPLNGLKELATRAGLSLVQEATLSGLFKDEYESFLAWHKYGLPAPKEMHGLVSHLDKNYPLLSAVIARKDGEVS